MHDPTLETPVTRRELTLLVDELKKGQESLGREVHELARSRQISWPLVLTVLALTGAAAGFGISNLSDVSALRSVSVENAGAVAELRPRTRALEANLSAVKTEQETQNRWMADVANLQYQRLEQLLRVHHPDIPATTYYPLAKIGEADGPNGGGH